MIKLLILLASIFTITACDFGASLYGRWVSSDPNCEMLCSFTISKQENAYSDMVIHFDKGPFSEAIQGPVRKIGDNKYIVKSGFGDFLMVLKGSKIYGADDTVYEKDNK